MKINNTLLLVFSCALVLFFKEIFDRNTFETLSVPNLIRLNGYLPETHEVTTEDGYILSLYRILFEENVTTTGRQPILLMHGLLGHADQFLLNTHENGSLAFTLANEGFDVWLGNTRGSMSGERHVHLDRSSNSFYNFSNHEMGVYDLPALMDYILKITGYKNLQYAGYSQGVRIFLIMASMKPDYQKKISLASLIAPSGYLENLDSWWLKPIGLQSERLLRFCTFTNLHVFPPEILKVGQTSTFFCQNIITKELCFKLFKMMVGDSGEITSDALPILTKYANHVPTKQLFHFGQTIISGHFRPWDYGPSGNLEAYGQETPPHYAIENVTVPIAVYYSLGDTFTNYKDSEKLCNTVKKCVRKFVMTNKKWTHVDFLMSKNAGRELNQPLSQFAKEFNES